MLIQDLQYLATSEEENVVGGEYSIGDIKGYFKKGFYFTYTFKKKILIDFDACRPIWYHRFDHPLS